MSIVTINLRNKKAMIYIDDGFTVYHQSIYMDKNYLILKCYEGQVKVTGYSFPFVLLINIDKLVMECRLRWLYISDMKVSFYYSPFVS